VSLSLWSLELIRQPSGRLVPVVRGVRCDVDTPSGSLWRTAEIVHVVTPSLLITRTRMFVTLAGKMSKQLARKLRVPRSLTEHFQAGFPPDTWAALIRYVDRVAPPGLTVAIAAASSSSAAQAGSSESLGRIAGLQILDSGSRLKARPVLRPDAGAASLANEALRGYSGKAYERPIPIGAAARRRFIDGCFCCRVVATGLDAANRPCVLLNFKDGMWEVLSTAEASELRRQRRFLCMSKPSCGRTGMDEEVPYGHGAQCQGPDDDGHSAGVPVLSDRQALHQAMQEVRPSAKDFWLQVAQRVGKSAEECQALANSVAGSPAAKRRRRDGSPAHGVGENKENEGKENEAPLEDVMAKFPQKDGPIRARKVRAIMGEKCFRDGHDFLQPAETPKKIATGDLLPSGLAPSPTSLDFLSSLHTGCTPTTGQKAALNRRLFGESPGLHDMLPVGDSPGRICCGLDDDDPVWNSLHDLGDVSWQPKGLDSFICETRARRGRLDRKALRASAASSFKRVSRASVVKHQQALRRAPALFRRVDAQLAREAAMEATPSSCAEDSDDEMAPLAYVPPSECFPREARA